METILKTTMYEVTKLVEDGLLEQLRSRSHEVESLKVQLQLTQKRLRRCDEEEEEEEEDNVMMMMMNRRKTDVNASPYRPEGDGDDDGLDTLRSGLSGPPYKKLWTGSHHELGGNTGG
ncbi:hypothetical protein NHX12_017995 [Muraenolepis orangiensis]|uniref:Uncharacterized protein n=1 Tax=Muraenolepis orangiensis TaxID=630683 RepID=A0A9Q0EVR2_9TELE|nr:hypothetical protein NHX12_017995 [Muraenolepis orangiensis]